MYLNASSSRTAEPRGLIHGLQSGLVALCLSVAAALTAGCGAEKPLTDERPAYAPARDEFSVMTYNLDRYGYHDRTGDGQADNHKPGPEREAIHEIILQVRPDILVVQEIGGPAVLEDFVSALNRSGLKYDFVEYLQRGDSEMNQAVLSRYPFLSTQSRLDDLFSIGEAQVPVERGFIDVDISINPAYTFRLMAAQLKNKEYHVLGHTEMRRNEARLLNKHVRHALQGQSRLNMLVVGDMNDVVAAAPLRIIMGDDQEFLQDIRPADGVGDIWTYFEKDAEQYHRYDYMLVSQGMRPELVPEKTRIVRHEKGSLASVHRPLVAVFRARDLSATPSIYTE